MKKLQTQSLANQILKDEIENKNELWNWEKKELYERIQKNSNEKKGDKNKNKLDENYKSLIKWWNWKEK